MKRTTRWAQGLLLTCLSLSVFNAFADPDTSAIEDLYADWRKAVQTADIPAYVAVLAEDVRLIPPGAEVIAGADGYGTFLEPVFEAADYVIEVVEPARIEVLGDIAIAEYRYVIHLSMKSKEGTIEQAGALTAARTDARYFDVLKKDDEGRWKIWRHTWHGM